MNPSPTGRYTDQWWYSQFVGLQHTVNSLAAQISPDGHEHRLSSAHRRIDELTSENEKLKLLIGELESKTDAVSVRLNSLIDRLRVRFDKSNEVT